MSQFYIAGCRDGGTLSQERERVEVEVTFSQQELKKALLVELACMIASATGGKGIYDPSPLTIEVEKEEVGAQISSTCGLGPVFVALEVRAWRGGYLYIILRKEENEHESEARYVLDHAYTSTEELEPFGPEGPYPIND